MADVVQGAVNTLEETDQGSTARYHAAAKPSNEGDIALRT